MIYFENNSKIEIYKFNNHYVVFINGNDDSPIFKTKEQAKQYATNKTK